MYIGVESGDRDRLVQAKKGGRPDVYLNAVRLLNEHGIGVSIGLVLGMKGESKQSLQKTNALAEELLKFDNIRAVEPNTIHVMPGSQDFADLMSDDPVSMERWEREDILPIGEITTRWLEIETDVSDEMLKAFQEHLCRHSPKVLAP